MGSQPFDAARALQLARDTFDIEARALLGLKGRTGESFGRVCEVVLACRGRVVVMGMGKSGHVGRKIAATLASTGTPALFVHPGEASHGDLGMVASGDVVLAISNSGESDELAVILPALKRLGVTLVPTWCSTARSRKRPARSSSRRPPARRRKWRSAMRSRSRCSTRAVSAKKTSPARIRAARSAASC
jgi:arabinose-5-phosphate isomerase